MSVLAEIRLQNIHKLFDGRLSPRSGRVDVEQPISDGHVHVRVLDDVSLTIQMDKRSQC